MNNVSRRQTDQTLHDLAQRIAAELDAVAAALCSALGHAIAAGEILIEAKAKVRHGQWLKWLAAHKFPQRTATHYMALARDREKLCDENGNVLPISVNRALAMLKWPYYGSGGYHDFENEYEPYRGWGRPAWGPFSQALETVIRLPQLNPPAARYVVRALRAGKTPGLSAAVLREVAALLIRYADALDPVDERAGAHTAFWDALATRSRSVGPHKPRRLPSTHPTHSARKTTAAAC
jgi:hypothetical protein